MGMHIKSLYSDISADFVSTQIGLNVMQICLPSQCTEDEVSDAANSDTQIRGAFVIKQKRSSLFCR